MAGTAQFGDFVVKAVHRMTHEESRLFEIEYYRHKSLEERVIAGWALAETDYDIRRNHAETTPPAITLQRVRRPLR